MVRKIKNKLRYLLAPNWQIYLGKIKGTLSDIEDDINKAIPLKIPYKDRWYADPFILKIQSKSVYILAEEFSYNDNRGVIVLLEVDIESCKLIKRHLLLKLETHLSFPIFKIDSGVIIIYPENAENNCLKAYTLINNGGKYSLNHNETILDMPLSDSVIFEFNDKYFLLTTMKPFSNGNELTVFISNNLLNNYNLHQKIVFGDNSARRAGDLFYMDNKFVTVSQDCNRNLYGNGLIFSEIQISEDNYKLSIDEIKRVYPKEKGILGIHTFNVKDEYFVIDKKIVNFPFLYKYMKKISIFNL
ncbi:glucosamine inositolphosphorylceramide transferase family protein [Bacteroides propionicifaciens]|uniref:glucosamine inositolphosphorylceramide transferase family protein n=1 Tax=Bacteroides propionicifaciens TaxID=392838 RepID=UPI000363D464|nr:hypothetical protein [Bacteroides propionicifaciens]